MVHKGILFVLLTLVAFQLKATNVTLLIKDATSSEPLSGVRVTYIHKLDTLKGFTKSDGTIELKDVQIPFEIECNSIGFESFHKTFNSFPSNFKYSISLTKATNQLNDVVITGQITPVLAQQSIYKVNTINATQIAQRGAVSLNDVLNYEMNNFISNDNILGSSVSIGGIGGQNVKILVNGIPVLGRENGNIELSQLNLSNVKRIETIQGPMSVMYGSNALGGVINLITNTPQKPFSFGVRTYLESIGRYNFSGNMSLIKKNHQLQISAARNFFQGWTPKDSIDRFQVWKPKTQYTGDIQYNFKYKKLNLGYFGSFMNEIITNKGVPIISPYEGYAFDEYYRTHRAINSISANIDVTSKEKLQFMNSYSVYNRTKNRFKKDLVTLQQIETQSVGDQDTSIFYNLNFRGVLSSSRIKNTQILAGYEYNYEQGKSFKLSEHQEPIKDLGLFASANYNYKKLSLQPSVRYTINSRFNKAVSPAFHAKWDMSSKTQLRASYARGFRAPSLKELYLQFIDQNHTIIGNENLKPEIGDHFELGIEHRINLNKGILKLGANGYYNSIKDMITLAVYNNHAVLRQYANIENYRNWISNVQVTYNEKKLTLGAGFGLIYVPNLGFIPQHQIFEASFNTSYFIEKIGTSVNFNYKFNSKQPLLTVDDQFLFTSPIHIANASLQKRFFSKKLLVQAGVKNLFNIQNSTLSGTINSTAGGHTSPTGMQVFPARSIFFDVNYNF